MRSGLIFIMALGWIALCCSGDKQHAPSPNPRAANKAGNRAIDAPAIDPNLRRFGDLWIMPLDAGSFDSFSLNQRRLIYYLVSAARDGAPMAFDQKHRYSLDLLRVLARLHQSCPADPKTCAAIDDFSVKVLVGQSPYDPGSGEKLVPPFDRSFWSAAIDAIHDNIPAKQIESLTDFLFDPKIETLLTVRPAQSGDPVLDSAINLYDPDITLKEVLDFERNHPVNIAGRLARGTRGLREEVYRAGGMGRPPGRGAAFLAGMIKDLRAAGDFASPEQKAALDLLIGYLRTADQKYLDRFDKLWWRREPDICLVMGFMEKYLDPLQQRGLFTAMVGIRDPSFDRVARKIAELKPYFDSHAPWPEAFRDKSPGAAQVGAYQLVGFAGGGGPIAHRGFTVMGGEAGGRWHMVFTNAIRAIEKVYDGASVEALSHDGEERRLARECGSTRVAKTLLHEVLGHGLEIASPRLAADPTDILGDIYWEFAEARADAVALYYAFDPALVAIGLWPSPACGRAMAQEYLRDLELELFKDVRSGAVIDVHLRAKLIVWGRLKRLGAVKCSANKTGRPWMLSDEGTVRRALGLVAAELTRIVAKGEKERARQLASAHADKVDPAWISDIRRRLAPYGLPRRVAVIAPRFVGCEKEAGGTCHTEPGRIEDIWPRLDPPAR